MASGLPSETDIVTAGRHVSNVPKAGFEPARRVERNIRAVNTRWRHAGISEFALARCGPSAWMQQIFQSAARNRRHSFGTPLSV
jgi:hypothetical protein